MIILKHWRLFTALFLILVLILFVSIKINHLEKLAKVKTFATEKTILHNPVPIVKRYQDSAGRNHVQIQANSGDIPQAALKDTAIITHSYADSVAAQLKIKDSQILELTRENITIKAENIHLKQFGKVGDSVFYYEDKFLQLYYYQKTRYADLSYHVNITAGKYTPASWMPFITRPAVIDFSADDPRAVINSVDHFTAIIPQKPIGFNVAASLQYDVNTGFILPAISPAIRLGRFHLADNIYYYQKARQAVSVSYDIIKINP